MMEEPRTGLGMGLTESLVVRPDPRLCVCVSGGNASGERPSAPIRRRTASEYAPDLGVSERQLPDKRRRRNDRAVRVRLCERR